jgi:NAD(P)-dependent dehydrogenase (short-subunit alcohol dehydrogenase family)
MRFKDQGVLVTGGASGIGEKVVAAFGREGAVVAVGDRDEKGAERVAEAVRKAGGRAHAFALDVTDPKGVASFVERAAQRLGRLDVLVNSAGVREISSVLDLPLEEWNRVMGVNVTGTFLCSQAFARAVLAKGGKGAIVNLASTLGVVAASNRPAYTASKHAVVGLVEQLALELAPSVRVNGVAPGFMRTDIRGPSALGQADRTLASLPDLDALAGALLPLQFLPDPADYTGHYVQLASRANAAATTGVVVDCDGGFRVRGMPPPPAG